MAIKIYNEVFILIHDELYDNFKKLGDPHNTRKFRRNSREPWELTYFGTSTEIYPDVFNGKTYKYYWCEKHSLHKNSKIGFREEPAGIIIEALNFLDINLPKAIDADIIRDTDIEATILIQLYLEQHKTGKKYLDRYSDVKVFDSETMTLLEKNKTELPIAFVADQNIQIEHQSPIKNKGVPEDDIAQLKKLVGNYMLPDVEAWSWKWFEAWQYFSKPFKKDFRRDKDYYHLAVRHIRRFENPFLFGFKNTVSNRSDFDEHTFEKHVTFKVFFTIKVRPISPEDFTAYQAYLSNELKKEDEISFLKKWVLDFYKKLHGFKRNKVEGSLEMSYDEYFADQPRLLDLYNSEDNLIYALRQDFNKMDMFRMWFRNGELPPDEYLSEVSYDKLEWWECIFNNGKWYIDSIKSYPINEPYLKVLFGRPQIINTL